MIQGLAIVTLLYMPKNITLDVEQLFYLENNGAFFAFVKAVYQLSFYGNESSQGWGSATKQSSALPSYELDDLWSDMDSQSRWSKYMKLNCFLLAVIESE